MEMVIKIHEKDYQAIKNGHIPFSVLDVIINGTPLPERHGRLIDYDDLIEQLDRYGRKNVKYQLPYSPTIIFADKEVNADNKGEN